MNIGDKVLVSNHLLFNPMKHNLVGIFLVYSPFILTNYGMDSLESLLFPCSKFFYYCTIKNKYKKFHIPRNDIIILNKEKYGFV